jgi:hypothetical protein
VRTQVTITDWTLVLEANGVFDADERLARSLQLDGNEGDQQVVDDGADEDADGGEDGDYDGHEGEDDGEHDEQEEDPDFNLQ